MGRDVRTCRHRSDCIYRRHGPARVPAQLVPGAASLAVRPDASLQSLGTFAQGGQPSAPSFDRPDNRITIRTSPCREHNYRLDLEILVWLFLRAGPDTKDFLLLLFLKRVRTRNVARLRQRNSASSHTLTSLATTVPAAPGARLQNG